ncbi:hypothetical protein ACHAXT_008406 [Thalassiosira profunda]
MDAKRLRSEDSSPESTTAASRVSRPTASAGSSRIATRAKLHPTDDLDRAHHQKSRGATAKENAPPNTNFAAMKKIMRRKQMATAARKELDAPSKGAAAGDGSSAGESGSLDMSDGSAWAMMHNHCDETTMDQEQASELAITPGQWKHELYSLSSVGSRNSRSLRGGDGASGVLSFLGESPLFDNTIVEEDEVENNLQRSAEKVKKLEEHLLRGAGGLLSPVQPEKGPQEKEVTFAIDDGWKTPRGTSSKYPKSPYVHPAMTPSKLSESMMVQANPLNESVIVSDGSDDELGDAVASPSPMKGIGGDADDEASEEEADVDAREDSELLRLESSASNTPLKRSHRSGKQQKNVSPTRASLMERNQTLVKEVRFADQTCVELSERKKHYKSQAGQFKQGLETATKENATLRENYGAALQETARLKVLVESIGEQRDRADRQAEAYRLQIEDAEKTHRSSLKRMEKTYQSSLKSSEEQMAGLNERLTESLATNADLRSKLEGDATNDASQTAMQARLDELQSTCDRQKDQLQREKNEREMLEHDRDGLQRQCDDLHQQLMEWATASDTLVGEGFFDEEGAEVDQGIPEDLEGFTPVKQLRLDACEDGDGSPQTPTSNLLTRTLRSELKRRQDMSDKFEQSEKVVTSLKERIADMRLDYEEARADNALLEEDLDAANEALKERDDRIATLSEEIVVLCQEGGASSTSLDGGASSTDVAASGGQESPSQGSCERETRSMLEERFEAVEETLEFTNDELVETKARLADTQELLDQTAGELERSEGELAEAQNKLTKYEARVDELFKDLTEKEVEAANAQKFSSFQDSTLRALKNKIAKGDAVNSEQRAQLVSCFRSLVALEKVLRTYEGLDGAVGRRLAEENAKVARLVATLRELVKEAPPRDAESGGVPPPPPPPPPPLNASECMKCQYTQQQISAISLERNDATLQAEKAQASVQEFRDELSKQDGAHLMETTALKKQCVELEAKVSAVTAHLKACEIKNQTLSKQESTLLQEKAALEKQCEDLKAKLAAVTSELTAHERKYETLSTTSAAAESEVSQQLNVIRSNNADLIQENERLRTLGVESSLQLENKEALLRASREEADGYRQDVTNAKAAFECLTTECDFAKASLEKLEREADGLRNEVNMKQMELKGCQDRLSTAQASFQEQTESLLSRCDELEARLSLEENGRVAAEESLDGATKHIATLEEAIRASQEEAKEKMSECQDLIVQVQQIQNALAEAEKEQTEADGTIADLESQLKEKTSALFAYEESVIAYKDDIRRLGNELQTTVQEKDYRIQTLEQACASRQTLFNEQLERTKRERDASTAELTEMIERLQEELRASSRKSGESSERAKLAVQDFEDEMFIQSEAQKDLEQKLRALQARLEEETTRHEETRNDLEDTQVEYARVTDILSAMEMDTERAATKLQDDVEDLAEERNRLEAENLQLEEEIHQLEANLNQAERIRHEQDAEIEGLASQNESLEMKGSLLKEKLKSLTDQNKSWQDSYKAQGEDLVAHGIEVSRLNGEISRMKEGILAGRY